MLFIQFLISAAVIVWAGSRLTVYADILSDRLNLGKVWIGIILLGVVTSLPEAVASLSAVVSLGAYDLAVGNLVGSNNYNLLLIVWMDFVYRRGAVTNEIRPNRSHTAAAVYAGVLSCVVILELLRLSGQFLDRVYLFGAAISLGAWAILAVYIAGMRHLSKLGELAPAAGGEESEKAERSSLYLKLFVSIVFVVGSAIWLANVCDDIARITGLGGTFIGSTVLALATSLPEMVVTLSAIKMKAFDLAVGNIFGSNMTNTFIIFLCEIFSDGFFIFNIASSNHIIMAVLSIVLSVVLLVGMRDQGKKTYGGLGWDSWLIFVLFLAGTGLLYQVR